MKPTRHCSVGGCEGKHRALGYCQTHYDRWRKNGSLEPRMRSRPRGLDAEGAIRWYGWTVTPDGCWEFDGPRHKQGYGAIVVGGKTQRTSRLAYSLWNGELDPALDVLHRCDNPPCINPQHLFLGSQADNNRDMREKGRSVKPVVLKGASAVHARLTDTQVQEIRSRYSAGGISQARLGADYGVTQTTVWGVVNHRIYKEESNA